MSKEKTKTNEVTEFTVVQKARVESWKLQFDFFKHLTTLCTGSILILVTFIDKVIPQPKFKWPIALSLALFLLSLLYSVLFMLNLANAIRSVHEKEEVDPEHGLEKKYVLISLSSFILGLLFLSLSAAANLFQK